MRETRRKRWMLRLVLIVTCVAVLLGVPTLAAAQDGDRCPAGHAAACRSGASPDGTIQPGETPDPAESTVDPSPPPESPESDPPAPIPPAPGEPTVEPGVPTAPPSGPSSDLRTPPPRPSQPADPPASPNSSRPPAPPDSPEPGLPRPSVPPAVRSPRFTPSASPDVTPNGEPTQPGDRVQAAVGKTVPEGTLPDTGNRGLGFLVVVVGCLATAGALFVAATKLRSPSRSAGRHRKDVR